MEHHGQVESNIRRAPRLAMSFLNRSKRKEKKKDQSTYADESTCAATTITEDSAKAKSAYISTAYGTAPVSVPPKTQVTRTQPATKTPTVPSNAQPTQVTQLAATRLPSIVLSKSAELIVDCLKQQNLRVVTESLTSFTSEDVKELQRYLVKKDRFRVQDELPLDSVSNNPKEPSKKVSVTIVSMVGEGRFASVYAVIRENVETPMALKIETLKGRAPSQLQNEGRILRELTEKHVNEKLAKMEQTALSKGGSPEKGGEADSSPASSPGGSGRSVVAAQEKYFRFPFFREIGKYRNRTYILMSLLGVNLDLLRKKMLRAPAYRSILMLALESLTALMDFHNAGYVHRDINPKNFCIGFAAEDRDHVHLIDFGNAVRADKSTPTTGREDHVMRDGTSLMFCSIEAHKSQAITKKSDLISWTFVVADLCRNALPWRKLTDSTKIANAKQAFLLNPGKSVELPKVVVDLIGCTMKLDAVNPDHGMLMKIIADAIIAQDPADATAPPEWKGIEF